MQRLTPRLHQVLDAIASHIPHRAALEASEEAIKAPLNRVATLHKAGFALCILGVIPFCFFAGLLFPFSLEIGALGMALGIFMMSQGSHLTQAQDFSGAARRPLTRTGWLNLHGGKLPDPSWETGRKLAYMPDPAQDERGIATTLLPLTVLVLSGGLAALGVSVGWPAFLAAGVCLAGLAWHIRLILWTRTRQNDIFVVFEDQIHLTRKNRTITAPLSSMNIKPGFRRSLFGKYAVFTGPKGKIECDYRYLWPVDRPLYEPESPWEELWRTE